MTEHRQKQLEVIRQIEEQVTNNVVSFSTIAPVEDFEKDIRMCLTSVHFPHPALVAKVQNEIISPLKQIDDTPYYYKNESYHMTIKNIRVISDPPTYTSPEIETVERVFSSVLPQHKKFTVYFYRLFLFANNLALFGTTDPTFDDIILDLTKQLKNAGIADDKVFLNSRYFFSNMTIARFSHVSPDFKEKVAELSEQIVFEPYAVDSVSLVTSNAVMKKRQIINTWNLP